MEFFSSRLPNAPNPETCAAQVYPGQELRTARHLARLAPPYRYPFTLSSIYLQQLARLTSDVFVLIRLSLSHVASFSLIAFRPLSRTRTRPGTALSDFDRKSLTFIVYYHHHI
ncbi:hypothetical protein G7K_1634-t1 [Saitoella complicata NRRL Y-17804]|uniref:Uncharacterized protein n=1 Tax=Saitoella complicata (strain BCRC 22490 / CBS 7301 / JCM 7358 / NBRC 10748 / NRRL Y-17804) TaxID=698492 RepID=A0A0E9NCK5_SAICN|nr:hypothetical protein G7K_1634-t1 [Saitoella complicata NRRL Y-17804]